MVEDILSMQTGSHVLGAFNIEFDSFVDNVVFCALIDRVGKYQLSMQRISAYKPMAESMPKMLREETIWSPVLSRPIQVAVIADIPDAVATQRSAPSIAASLSSKARTVGLVKRE